MSLGEAKGHDTEDDDEMSNLSESEVRDIVCGLQLVRADDDAQGDGWQPVSKGSRTTRLKEYKSNLPVFENSNYWSEIAAEKESNRFNVTIRSKTTWMISSRSIQRPLQSNKLLHPVPTWRRWRHAARSISTS